MQRFKLKTLTEEDARAICSWRYEGELAVYDFSHWEEIVQKGHDITNAQNREEQWVSIVEESELVAYGRISQFNSKSMLGIGIKPALCGKGLGKIIMRMLIDEAKRRFPNAPIVLTVRTFNARAIRCYKGLGFEILTSFISPVDDGETEFFYMQLKESSFLREESI